MKKVFAPAFLSAWITGVLPDNVFRLGKKTPWYRRSWTSNMPLIAVALMMPLALFLLWKGGSLIWQKAQPQEK